MARFVYEQKTNVWWVPTIATTSTPRVNELTAGTSLTNFIAKDGVEVNINTNNVDSATIAQIFDAQSVGSYGADLKLTMFRDDGTDTAWNTCVYGSTGYVVISRFTASGSNPANGAKVEVWPAQMHQPSPQNSAANEVVKFVEVFAVTSQPYLSATVTTATT